LFAKTEQSSKRYENIKRKHITKIQKCDEGKNFHFILCILSDCMFLLIEKNKPKYAKGLKNRPK